MRVTLAVLAAGVLLAASALAQTASKPDDSASQSSWKFSPSVKSKMDDRDESAMAILQSTTPFQGRNIDLVLACNVGHGRRNRIKPVEIWLDLGAPLRSQYVDHLDVRVRFDNDKPRTESWGESGNFLQLFHRTLTPQGQIDFAKRIAGAHRMLIELAPFAGNAQVVEFHTEGLSPHLDEMAQLCGWPK